MCTSYFLLFLLLLLFVLIRGILVSMDYPMSSNTPSSIDFLPDQNPPFVYRLLHLLHPHHRTRRLPIVHANLPNPVHPGFGASASAIAYVGQTWHARSP